MYRAVLVVGWTMAKPRSSSHDERQRLVTRWTQSLAAGHYATWRARRRLPRFDPANSARTCFVKKRWRWTSEGKCEDERVFKEGERDGVRERRKRRTCARRDDDAKQAKSRRRKCFVSGRTAADGGAGCLTRIVKRALWSYVTALQLGRVRLLLACWCR